MLYMPNLDSNLLGRDLQVQLNIGVASEKGQIGGEIDGFETGR